MKTTLQIALLAAFASSAPVGAQALIDPMRPANVTSGERYAVVARPAGPVLEQIVLGDGRKFAVISGRKVAVGDRLGEVTVVSIGADQVTLKGGTTQVLRMFPHSDRKSAGTAPTPQPRKAEQGS
jgi:hypothetical protein